MECNFLMGRLLAMVNLKEIGPLEEYRIWKAYNLDGDPFWGVGDFCGLDTKQVVRYGRELTDLEWDGNEIWIQDDDIKRLMEHAMAIYLSIKQQLQQEYPEMEFDLMVSVSSEELTAVIRFWAVREGYHYIDISKIALEKFKEEAVLTDRINRITIKKQAALFAETFAEYQLEFGEEADKLLTIIKNPESEDHIKVWFEDEMTMVFGRFHSHYMYEEMDELIGDIRGILSGTYAVLCVESEGRWFGSSLAVPEEIPEGSGKKLLHYLFRRQKEFRREIQKKGGEYSLTFWDPRRSYVRRIEKSGRMEEMLS